MTIRELRMLLVRNVTIVRLRLEGKTLEQIANIAGISRQRVSDIFSQALKNDKNVQLKWRALKAKQKKVLVAAKKLRELNKTVQIVKRTCRGCRRRYSARDMRTHKCKIAWYRRTGKPWQYVQKRKKR
jgi:hypothetical protein